MPDPCSETGACWQVLEPSLVEEAPKPKRTSRRRSHRENPPEDRTLRVKAGTPGYIAPEVMQSRPYGPRADMFSVGATLMTMITGQPPVWLDNIGKYHFPDRKELKNLSTEGRDFIEQLLASQPKLRPTAAEALQDAWLHTEHITSDAAHQIQQDTYIIERLKRFNERTKLQQCARASVAALANLQHPEKEQEVEALQSIFFAVDKDGDGQIDPAELARALNLDEETEAANLLAGPGASGDGRIAFSEWIAAASSSEFFSSQDEAWHAFQALDSDGDGYISAKDLQSALPKVFSPEEVEEDLQQYCEDGDARLDFKEFRKVLRGSLSAFNLSISRRSKSSSPLEKSSSD